MASNLLAISCDGLHLIASLLLALKLMNKLLLHGVMRGLSFQSLHWVLLFAC